MGVVLADLHFVDLFLEVAVRRNEVEAAVEIEVGEQHAELQIEPTGGPQPVATASSVNSSGPV